LITSNSNGYWKIRNSGRYNRNLGKPIWFLTHYFCIKPIKGNKISATIFIRKV